MSVRMSTFRCLSKVDQVGFDKKMDILRLFLSNSRSLIRRWLRAVRLSRFVVIAFSLFA